MSAKARTSFSSVVLLTTAALIVALLARAEGQTQQTKQVMQQKLAQSQQLLGAVVTSNWAALTQRTQALESLTRQPGWQFLETPEYRTYTTAFEKATQALAAAAQQRDQRTAATAYSQLVNSCVECHRYVARARIAADTLPLPQSAVFR
ncbi:MAG TPA: cytochrome c [Vicinamibacterales bacterium]|nr:cytochrome c [Vicinamibacterales bacterium]